MGVVWAWLVLVTAPVHHVYSWLHFKMASLEEGQSDALKSAITKRRKEKEKEDETQDHFEAEFARQKKEVDGLCDLNNL